MLLIKNARVIDPKTKTDQVQDILTADGRISQIGEHLQAKWKGNTEDMQIIDARGLTAAPGLIDVHVHFRDPGFTYKEDITTGAKAAAKGGYTTVVMMANTKPAVDSVETLQDVLKKAENTPIHVLATAAVTEGLLGQCLTDMECLKAAGAAGFTDDGIPIMDERLLERAFLCAKKLNVPVSLHEEDPRLISNNGINAGKASRELHIGGSPREAEASLVERDLQIALRTGADVNIQHISSKEAVALVREARKLSSHIYAEATPHHFTLTEDAVAAYGTLAKMNPPLRTEEDRLAVIKGLKDGTIGLIATDHAPHSREEKARPITEAPSGIIGLETALALGITELVKKGYLTLPELIARMSAGPAELYHLEEGTLAAGARADIVLFDENEVWIVKDFISKSNNSPFTGRELTGRVKYTICEGRIVYQDDEKTIC
ncbi:MAG: dihydroorotase [Lachnospiraceae bacterium]